MNCSQCQSTLLVEIFGTANPVRCASCGHVSIPVNEASTLVSRHARRSLWLGLVSIFLLFLTGIPAIWYGVSSLLQMRFVRSRKRDRQAAAAGVTLGVLFGVFWSGFVLSFGGVILFFMMINEDTFNPVRIAEIRSEIGSIEVPADFVALEANIMKGQFQRVNWQDGRMASDAEGRIRLVKAKFRSQIGSAHIFGPKLEFDIHQDIDVDASAGERETVLWQFAGKERKIVKVTEPALKGDLRLVRYVASTEEDKEIDAYVLAVCVREDGKYSEQDVKEIFESFAPANE